MSVSRHESLPSVDFLDCDESPSETMPFSLCHKCDLISRSVSNCIPYTVIICINYLFISLSLC